MPKGIATSGFPRVRETCRQIGIEFDPWQSDLNRCLLAKTANGDFAADTAVISIPRQVGKTFDIGAVVFAECIADPGTTVVWTAHRFKVSRETFNELRTLAKSPKLAPHIDFDAITTAAGNECIPFRNGSRIVFAARERGAIRGFTKVRLLVLDEAQILTDSVLADLAPTMNQAINPLIILMGTPPKPTDPSEVFTNLRFEALEGQSEGVLYVEFSADPGSSVDDRAAWKKANPSFPDRTPARAMLRMRKLLSAEDFAREALGVWDSDSSPSVLSLEKWESLRDPAEWRSTGLSLAVVTNFTRSVTSIVAAGEHDGRRYVEVVDHRPGVRWVTDRLLELRDTWQPCVTLIDPGSPAGSLLADLEDAGIVVTKMTTQDAKQACGAFYDAVDDLAVRHVGQDILTSAARHAQQRVVGDGWLWELRKAQTDVTPLIGATNALWGWTTCHASGDILQAVW